MNEKQHQILIDHFFDLLKKEIFIQAEDCLDKVRHYNEVVNGLIIVPIKRKPVPNWFELGKINLSKRPIGIPVRVYSTKLWYIIKSPKLGYLIYKERSSGRCFATTKPPSGKLFYWTNFYLTR